MHTLKRCLNTAEEAGHMPMIFFWSLSLAPPSFCFLDHTDTHTYDYFLVAVSGLPLLLFSGLHRYSHSCKKRHPWAHPGSKRTAYSPSTLYKIQLGLQLSFVIVGAKHLELHSDFNFLHKQCSANFQRGKQIVKKQGCHPSKK